MVALGLTEIELPVNPPVQLYVPPTQPVAVKVTPTPAQTEAAFGVIVGLGAWTVTVTLLPNVDSHSCFHNRRCRLW